MAFMLNFSFLKVISPCKNDRN